MAVNGLWQAQKYISNINTKIGRLTPAYPLKNTI